MTYKSFSEFYPFYLSQHANVTNRRFHLVGTMMFLIIALYSIIQWTAAFVLYIPLISYGLAWIGHFVFEKNKPATFKYPFYSLIGDFRMTYDIFRGKLKI